MKYSILQQYFKASQVEYWSKSHFFAENSIEWETLLIFNNQYVISNVFCPFLRIVGTETYQENDKRWVSRVFPSCENSTQEQVFHSQNMYMWNKYSLYIWDKKLHSRPFKVDVCDLRMLLRLLNFLFNLCYLNLRISTVLLLVVMSESK